jgi:hypothetical protein
LKSPAVPHERTQAERKSDKKRLIEERLQQFITKRNKRLMRKFLRLWYLWYRKIKTRKLQEQRERQQREAEYQKFIQSLDTSVHSLHFVQSFTKSFNICHCLNFTLNFFNLLV